MNFKTIPVNAIGVGLVTVAGAVTYLLGYLPLQISQQALDRARARTESLALNVEDNEKQNELLQEEIASVRRVMAEQFCNVANPDTPTIQTISDLLASHHVELDNLKEGSARHASGTWIEVQIRGRYEDIIRVVYDLRHMNLPAKVTALHLSKGNDTEELQVRIQVEIYPKRALAA